MAAGSEAEPAQPGHPGTQTSNRTFSAFAMPAGDRRLGVPGPLVRLVEYEGGRIRREIPLSEDEAHAMREALCGALRALALGRRYDAEAAQPRAHLGPYPFAPGNARAAAERAAMETGAAEAAASAADPARHYVGSVTVPAPRTPAAEPGEGNRAEGSEAERAKPGQPGPDGPAHNEIEGYPV